MFDGISALTLVLWVTTGACLGGVATPVLYDDRKANDWVLALLGTVLGGIGFFVLLIPLWIVLSVVLPISDDKRPAWRRDALTQDEVAAIEASSTEFGPLSMLPMLRENFWPKDRPAEEHSHRLTYIGVFMALGIITAIEVLLTVLNFDFDVTGPLVALSTAKVVLVVMFFMHLRYDSKWYTWVFVFSMPFAALIVTVLALA